jgi:CDP-diacylglycerol--serine O-phosphatidyltransferase
MAARIRRIRVTRSFIPNMFTVMNLFGGFIAIARISEGQFLAAAGFIMLSAVFDVLDGAVARLTKSTGDFGAELDSLCDAVSFGVAPAFMVYKAHFWQSGEIGLVIASLPAIAGVLRLARFNVQTNPNATDKRYFRGMPIPAGALTVISYVLFYHLTTTPNAVVFIPDAWKPLCITFVTVLTAVVMVSTIRYDAMPIPTSKVIRERPLLIAFFMIGLIAGLVSKGAWVFPFMLLYISIGAVRGLVNVVRASMEDDENDGEDEADEL